MTSAAGKRVRTTSPDQAQDAGGPRPVDVLNQVHDGVVVTDLYSTVRSWNAAAERIYGYTAAEMLGQSVSLLYFPEDLQATTEWVTAALVEHGAAEGERRSRRKDGSEVYIDVRVTFHCDDAGQVIGTIGCTTDVTERHRARAEEARQRADLRLILDSMPAMVWYKDRDNNILRANAAAAAFVGRTIGDIEGRSTYDLHPEEAAMYHRDDLEVIESGVAKLGIVELLQVASGEKRWIRTDKIPYRSERGDIVGVLVFAVDIDDQKRAEQALEQARDTLEMRVRDRTAALAAANAELRSEIEQRRQAEERLEMALWATGLGMWEWDARHGFSVSDERWAAMLGYGLDEVASAGAFWERLVHPDDRPQLARAWTAHVIEGSTPYLEVVHRVRAKSGEYRWMLTRGRVFERGPQGESLRLAGTNLDITARKMIEEQADRHQAELAHILRLETVNCLAAELAHEINQPLGAIANYASGLAERVRNGQIEPPAMLEAAGHIGAQALRAGVVLQRLRTFMRKDTPPRRAADVNQLVQSAVELVEAEARRLGVGVTLQLGQGLPPVRADGIQIEQVIVNLLRNALEAVSGIGDRHGEVTVTTRGGDAVVEVQVRDTGGGVPPEAQQRLFEPFFTTKAEGLGMGLSISRSIVEAHGGRLWVDPADGHGASFFFTLPVP